MRKFSWLLLFLCLLPLPSCKKSNGPAIIPSPRNNSALNTACTDKRAELEQDITSALTATSGTEFTILLEAGDGAAYSYSKGTSTSATLYRSASTSKLVTAVVILSLVDRGYLTLESRPQDLISSWTPATGDPAAGITLRHLMSFTSGFHSDPPCMHDGSSDMVSCVHGIYDMNIGNRITPGSEFYYANAHLQVAGLMAVKARGYADWTGVFDEFRSRTGLFPHSTYDLPSATNPLLAGGMHWTAGDYLDFLRALQAGRILSTGMRNELRSDQRGGAHVVYSPASAYLGEDWSYGLGTWIECKSSSFNCGSLLGRNSSPGAFGAYPFIDFEKGCFGIVAMEAGDGSFTGGIALFRSVEVAVTKWAAQPCGSKPILYQ